MSLRITHTPENGTMLEGSRKGDGAWDAIKAAQKAYKLRGWKFFPSIRAIGVSQSRDRAPDLYNIKATAKVLEDAGFEVTIEVDTAAPTMDDAEGRRAERMDDRADALADKAKRKGTESAARWDAAREIAENIPMGQPILVGHHSEARHRRDLARMDANQRASVELEKEADRAAHGAKSAGQHMDHREDPRRTMRRIKTLEADRRRVQRGLDGYVRNFRRHDGSLYMQEEHKPAEGLAREQYLVQAAYLDEQIRYWKGLLAKKTEDGEFTPIDLSKVKKGDQILYWNGWRTVIRVNKVTVSCESGYSWPDKCKIDEIRGHRPQADTSDVVDLDAAQAVTE